VHRRSALGGAALARPGDKGRRAGRARGARAEGHQHRQSTWCPGLPLSAAEGEGKIREPARRVSGPAGLPSCRLQAAEVVASRGNPTARGSPGLAPVPPQQEGRGRATGRSFVEACPALPPVPRLRVRHFSAPLRAPAVVGGEDPGLALAAVERARARQREVAQRSKEEALQALREEGKKVEDEAWMFAAPRHSLRHVS